MKNINWKVRVKNPAFWAGVGVAVLVPVLTYLGMSWEDVTTWAVFGNLLLSALKNPVIVASVAVSVYNAIIDPTTKGLRDSEKAMTYETPN